jgi:hypothetical protein
MAKTPPALAAAGEVGVVVEVAAPELLLLAMLLVILVRVLRRAVMAGGTKT